MSACVPRLQGQFSSSVNVTRALHRHASTANLEAFNPEADHELLSTGEGVGSPPDIQAGISAQLSWRRLRGFDFLAQVIAGVKFRDSTSMENGFTNVGAAGRCAWSLLRMGK